MGLTNLAGVLCGRQEIELRKATRIENFIYIWKVANSANMSFSDAREDMRNARKEYDITFRTYFEKKVWKVSDEDRRKLGRKYNRYAKQLEEITGMTYGQAIETLKSAHNKYGVSAKDYVMYSFFDMDEEEQAQRAEKLSKKERNIEKIRAKNVRTVMKETGWSEAETIEEMNEARERCGAYYKNYCEYRFWELHPKTQDTYFNNSHINRLIRKYVTTPEKLIYFKNKRLFNENFSEFLGRRWTTSKDIDAEKLKETFSGCDKVMYKPVDLSRGKGIRIFELNGENLEDVAEEMRRLPSGVVEEFITQHPALADFSKGASVNTIRIMTILDNSKCYIPYVVIRLGHGKKPLDHMHFGGVIAPVDPDTGVISHDPAGRDGTLYEKHPASGLVAKGFQIPYWDEVKRMVRRASKRFPSVGFLGWDVAITDKGPVIVEANTYPSAASVQMPFISEHKGVRPMFDRFLA